MERQYRLQKYDFKEIEQTGQMRSETGSKKQIETILSSINGFTPIIEQQKNNIWILLGITGTGKTTLAAYLANLKLLIKCRQMGNIKEPFLEYSDSSHEKYGKIGQSILDSETTIPNIFPFDETISIVDCPGIQDSKGVEYDVINAYYSTQVITRAKKIKFIIVLNGQEFEQGLENKGITLKKTIETLCSLSEKSPINFEKNVIVIFTRTTKDLSFFKQRLTSLVGALKNDQIFCKQNLKYINQNKIQIYLTQLSKVQIGIFPLPVGDTIQLEELNYYQKQTRLQLVEKIQGIEYYDNVNQDMVLRFGSEATDLIQSVRNYSREQVSQLFDKICITLSDLILLMKESQINTIKNFVEEIKSCNKNFQSNKEFLKYIQQNIFENIIIISQQSIQPDKNHLKQIEEYNGCLKKLEFYLSDVYDGLIIRQAHLYDSSNIQFGHVSEYEVENGLTILYKTYKQQINQYQSLKEQEDLKYSIKQQERQNQQQLKESVSLSNQIKYQSDLQYENQKKVEYQKQKAERQRELKKQEEERYFEQERNSRQSETVDGFSFATNVVSSASMGFRVAGPVGALIGGVIGVVCSLCSIF